MTIYEKQRIFFDKWLDIISDKPLRIAIMDDSESAIFKQLLEKHLYSLRSLRAVNIIHVSHDNTSSFDRTIDESDLLIVMNPSSKKAVSAITWAASAGIPCIVLDRYSSVEDIFPCFSPLNDSQTSSFEDIIPQYSDGDIQVVYTKRWALHIINYDMKGNNPPQGGFTISSLTLFDNLLKPVLITEESYQSNRFKFRSNLYNIVDNFDHVRTLMDIYDYTIVPPSKVESEYTDDGSKAIKLVWNTYKGEYTVYFMGHLGLVTSCKSPRFQTSTASINEDLMNILTGNDSDNEEE